MKLSLHAQVIKLRHDGYSIDEVAREVGVSPIKCLAILDDAMTELQGDSIKHAAAIKELELLRLETATKVVMPMVESGSGAGINLLLKIQDRRARYLGLDTPIKMDGKITIDVPWLTPNRLAYKHADEISPPAEVIELEQSAVPIEQSISPETHQGWREGNPESGRNANAALDDLSHPEP